MSSWRARLLVGLAGVAGGYVLLPYDSPIRRTARSTRFGVITTLEYKRLKWRGLHEDKDELSKVHSNTARRLYTLCADQGGIYTKMGQHISTVGRSIPTEYATELAKLKDQAKYDSFDDVRKTIQEDFHAPIDTIFSSFDKVPIASASLAQVHHGVLQQTEQPVAVKVQHPRVHASIASDLRTFKFVTNVLVPYFFDGLDLHWIVEEFERDLRMELDFRVEANNAIRASEAFREDPLVKVPEIYAGLTSERVLTMEFIHGVKIEHLNEIPSAPKAKVIATLENAVAKMIFVDGFVHGDLHTGNMLITPNDKTGFNLVLLDHGLYRELEERFRTSYCLLWRSLVAGDVDGLTKAVTGMGLPGKRLKKVIHDSRGSPAANRYTDGHCSYEQQGYAEMFSKVFAKRKNSDEGPGQDGFHEKSGHERKKKLPPKAVTGMGLPGSAEMFSKVFAKRKNPEEGPGQHGFHEKSGHERKKNPRPKMNTQQVNKFLEDLPKELIVILRTTNVVATIGKSLGEDGNQFQVNARYAIKGMHKEDKSHLSLWKDQLLFETTMVGFSAVAFLMDLKQRLEKLFRIQPPETEATPFAGPF
eukprot:CAMPEP_0184753952 /NCGR_PEP_ID=MMETSP0315-20130426/44370_1 /TAXON_ID=101924 /ORGANISM="Rhodosorus marinus, Strain UTEX LB 2760" /LENGTH=586 /DNA_ID=CAMNT_0027233351 /DNA_START=185 /DNA_END=1947 /DNA_ORIENTATION=+